MSKKSAFLSVVLMATLVWTPMGLLAGDEHSGKLETHWANLFDEFRGGAFLGVYLREVTPEDAAALGLKGERGALVTGTLEDTPAREAGLQKGDILLAWNGQNLESAVQLRRYLKETPGERTVELTLLRNRVQQKVKVKLEAKPSLFKDGAVYFDAEHRDQWQDAFDQLDEGGEEAIMELQKLVEELQREFDQNGGEEFLSELLEGLEFQDWDIHFDSKNFKNLKRKPRLGVHLQDLNPQLAEYFGVKGGVLVAKVVPGSAAEKAGLKAGDVITEADGQAMTDSGDLRSVLRGHGGGDLELNVVRDHQQMRLNARLPMLKAKTT